MLDPGHPLAPKFWRYETSGVLAAVVQRYLEGAALSLQEVAYMRAYLRQWINSPVWDMNPYRSKTDLLLGLKFLRDGVDRINSRDDISTWLHYALEVGIDPL